MSIHRCTTADCPYFGKPTENLSCGCHRKDFDIVTEQLATARERINELLRFNNEFEERARKAERLNIARLRPLSEWHDDIGDVLWWKLPITEAPWVGSPLCVGKEVMIESVVYTIVNGEVSVVRPYDGARYQRVNVGGWPGYHTHWSPLPLVKT